MHRMRSHPTPCAHSALPTGTQLIPHHTLSCSVPARNKAEAHAPPSSSLRPACCCTLSTAARLPAGLANGFVNGRLNVTLPPRRDQHLQEERQGGARDIFNLVMSGDVVLPARRLLMKDKTPDQQAAPQQGSSWSGRRDGSRGDAAMQHRPMRLSAVAGQRQIQPGCWAGAEGQRGRGTCTGSSRSSGSGSTRWCTWAGNNNQKQT